MFDNVLPFNSSIYIPESKNNTPISDKIEEKFNKLKRISKYKSNFDIESYRNLELRFQDDLPRGGIIYKDHIRTFDDQVYINSYGRGCLHDILYCEKRKQLIMHDYWNKPFPMPIDISAIWNSLYKIFETDLSGYDKLRKLIKENGVILGYDSDSFGHIDYKYKTTKEVIKMLNFYNVKYKINTRSDLIATDRYMELLDKNLCEITFNIASTNDQYNKLIEPGAPSSKRRLRAAQKLIKNNFDVSVHIDFFPIYEHGYFTENNKKWEPFKFSTFEMIDEIANYGIGKISIKTIEPSSFCLNRLEERIGRNLRVFYKTDNRTYTIDDKELKEYYKRFQAKGIQNNIEIILK